jgi:subtilisin family serine protease
MIVICAAGNTGGVNSLMYPGRYPNTYCVGAINDRGKTSAFSSRGTDLDIMAPGEKMLTTSKNNSYATVSGTSFSAPTFAGVVACLLQAGIKITHEMVTRTAIDIEEEGFDDKSGYGVLSPERMFEDGGREVVVSDYEDLKQSYYLLGKYLREQGIII